jgi:hypothetical protein
MQAQLAKKEKDRKVLYFNFIQNRNSVLSSY